jgi:putative ABC transport system permease protein
MTAWTLIVKSLRYHARSHLGALLGSMVGSAVLIGALVVGDSVRGSLRDFALARLGQTQLAMASNDRFFRSQLANELAPALDAPVSPALQMLGTAGAADASARANRVQVLGVQEDFWRLNRGSATPKNPSPGEVILNEQLARQLGAKVGETIMLRVPKPSQLSRDAPLSPQEDSSVGLRVVISHVATSEEFGDFSLQANQVAPFNAFVSLPWLQEQVKLPDRANLLLVGASKSAGPHTAATALARNWQLADAELELRELPDGGGVELRTSRVFLDAPITQAALRAATNATGVLTYLVNELRVGDRDTPYSMVTAAQPPLIPQGLADDEILISEWLADDLKSKPGDELELTYFVVGTMRKLDEQKTRFRIRSILPMTGAGADRGLMPDFPGLKDAENCRDWDVGFAIDTDKMRAKDQKYWETFKGTPKAFITLGAGQKLWSNRFGNLTAVRYPGPISKESLATTLRDSIEPGSLGFTFQPVLTQAQNASAQSQDFGQLFLGFSFFLIAAALLLMALMFQFGVEQRAGEIGTLLALGFTPRQVRRLFLFEGGLLALLGALGGILGGIYYAKAMLYGLSTIWRKAVGTSALHYYVSSTTLMIGAVASVLIAWVTIWLALRKQARQPAPELLAEGAGSEMKATTLQPGQPRRGMWIGTLAGILAMLILGSAAFLGKMEAGAFFGAGALLLMSGLGFMAAFLASLACSESAARLSLLGMGLRNSTRRRKRSLATLGLLACGSFLIMSIGVFRLDANADASKRSSGTGGFALIGETALPVFHDLNSEDGQQFFALDSKALTNVAFVPLRVRDGEDASCLNLNRAQKPRILGVQPKLLQDRNAFTFAKIAPGLPKDQPWLLLKRRQGSDEVPAIADQASIQWALGKKVGDTLDYTDERGKEFKIRLVASVANSVLQGSLLIDEDEFVERFPKESGYRMFFIDAPSNQADSLSAVLSKGLRDVGLELIPAARRLAEFNAVQNTYLSTFQVLGGLGLLLGSVGLGVVVLRNVLERRGELALLLAVGYRPRSLKWLIMSEHGALLVLGLGVGVIAALVSVLPALLSPGGGLPYLSLILTLGAVLLSGGIWTWLATWLALRGKLLDALRNN